MKKLLKRVVISAGFVTLMMVTSAFIKPMNVNLEDLPKVDRWETSLAADQVKKIKQVKDPLTRAALNEALGNYDDCVENARRVPVKSVIRDWAFLLEITCAREAVDNAVADKSSVSAARRGGVGGRGDRAQRSPAATKNRGVVLAESLRRLESASFDVHSKFLQERKVLAQLAAQLSLCRWYDKHSQWKELRASVQKALRQEYFYNKGDRSQLFFYAGNALVAERQWGDAFWNFLRARDLNPELVNVEVRVRSVLPMLPANLRDQFEAKLSSQTEATTVTLNPSIEELDLFNQATAGLTRGDSGSAVEALVKLIKKFPGGIKAKWAQDKMLELLNQEIEKSKGPDGPSVAKKRIISEMLNFDGDHVLEWGKSLIDSQAYVDAAPLLKKAAELSAGSPKAARTFFLAGRAFQLSGQYPQAKEMYRALTKNYPASPDVVDGAIQWALVSFNESDASEAIANLEIARAHKMTNQQDLVSLFWLYEAYKMRGTETGVTDRGGELMKRFGLTYYGIIAFSDLKKSLPQYEKAKDKSGKVFFSEAETNSLERARALLAAGLLEAATDEIAPILNRPLAVAEDQYLANFYAQALKYQKAFSLLSNATDEVPTLKNDFVVHQFFPKEYWAYVSDDKRRADVDPYLLLSVMKQESAFDKDAVSHSGALGLMQMIPPTAQEVKQDLSSDAQMPQDLTRPATNIKFCAYYLAKLLKKYNGSVPLALAAYNAGPARINQFVAAHQGVLKDTWVDELPWAETSFYVKAILKNYVVYRMLYGGMSQLPTPPWK